MSAPDDPRLLSVAESISDGAEVDWKERQEPQTEISGRVLRELQVLEQIAAFHRSTEPSGATTAEETTTAPPGTTALNTTFGRWGHLTLLKKIDEGAFGSVYRAHDPKLQTDVALKLLRPPDDRAIDPARVLKEARLLARIHHPNVVRVYGVDVIGHRAGIWMEFVDGQTLAALLRRGGPLGAREAALIGADLCQALAAVHRAGLIHGDVKARNVMRESGGRTVLMDFGTGKDLGIQSAYSARGIDLAGTPLYLAPEVFHGQPRSKLTDIYSLGVLLFHLVTNQYPVEGRTLREVEEGHERGPRRQLRDLRPDLPPPFVDAVECALASDPGQRFQTVGAFEAALTRALGRMEPAATPMKRRWWLAVAAGLLVAAVAAGKYWISDPATPTATTPHTGSSAAVPSSAVAASRPSYRIDTALYRRRADGEARLRAGDDVAPGDQLFARLIVSAPTYIYIVNEDERGESFLLFPLPGQSVENPIAPGRPTRVPGTLDDEVTWQITSAGGREHFLIFASPERLQAFEELFTALPRPALGKPITSSKLSDRTLGKLRGVGGLVAEPSAHDAPRLAGIFTSPLRDSEETANGLWVRQLTLENPSRP